MKKFIFTLVSFLIIGIGASQAQNKAYIDTKSSKTVVNERLMSYTFTVDNISSKDQLQVIEKKFKTTKMVSSVSAELITGNKARFVALMIRKENRKTLQQMLLNAGITKIVIDGTEVETTKAIEYLDAKKDK
ncbi:MAG: hypothetical protein IPH89_05975 [Bacteroidetes bacterium]|nr:hypothetical protein [Bacteroidota bacterium]